MVHGEDSVCDEFTQCLIKEHGFDAAAPYTGAVYDFTQEKFIVEGNKKKRKREEQLQAREIKVYLRDCMQQVNVC